MPSAIEGGQKRRACVASWKLLGHWCTYDRPLLLAVPVEEGVDPETSSPPARKQRGWISHGRNPLHRSQCSPGSTTAPTKAKTLLFRHQEQIDNPLNTGIAFFKNTYAIILFWYHSWDYWCFRSQICLFSVKNLWEIECIRVLKFLTRKKYFKKLFSPTYWY